MPTPDALTALMRALDRQFQQLDVLGIHGDARRRAVGRVFTIARERGLSVPTVMGEALSHMAATGTVPKWLTEEAPNADT